MPRLLARVLATLVACGVSADSFAAEKFPEKFFFPDRPAALKALETKPPPELKVKNWIGEAVSVPESRGKVVVIDFWATWCGPCMAAIPKNVGLVNKYKDKGLVFVGVHDSNAGWDKADATVKRRKINYPVVRDEDGGPSAKAFKLAFWPTYVIIDKHGVVRGAGLNPAHLEDAVKILMAEPGPPGLAKGKGSPAGLPADWFYAGHARPNTLRKIEGKPAPKYVAAQWRDKPLTPEAASDRIIVVSFLASGNALSMKHAETLAKLEGELGPQGVLFLSVCPEDDDWEAITKAVEEKKAPKRVFRDAAAPDKAPPGTSGATAMAHGVRYLPCTIVVDGSGVVRAAGVRVDKLKDITGKLLAEQKPPAEEDAEEESETTEEASA